MSRRDQIVMTDEEAAAFLDEQRIVTCATLGPRGWPHLMPLWYVVRDGTLWAWTYAKSQKVRNLERDPRCTLQVEAGGDVYSELRGVMIEAEAVHPPRPRDGRRRRRRAARERYGGARGRRRRALEAMRRQARQARGVRVPRDARRATWDHRKLGGTY